MPNLRPRSVKVPSLKPLSTVASIPQHHHHHHPSGLDDFVFGRKADIAAPPRAHPHSQQKLDGFHQLVQDLSVMLESTPARSIADIHPRRFIELMKRYASRESEWSKYAFKDLSRGYTRNLVDSSEGKSNLLVLVWSPGQGSPIHDHADAHCIMKVLKGSLKESRYAWPLSRSDDRMDLTGEATMKTGDVRYMSDQLGLHRMTNPNPKDIAVSLHLYTPPNAAKHGCNVFNEETGEGSHVPQCHFFSEYGIKNETR